MVCKCNCVPPDCLPSSTARGESRNGPAQILDLHIFGIASKSGMPQHCLSLSFFGFPILTQPNVRPGDTAGLIAACSKDLPVAIQLNGIIERIAAPLPLILFPPVTGCHRMSQAPLRDILASKILQRSYEMLNPGLASNLAALPGRGRNAANHEDGWILMQDIELKSWDTEFRQVSTRVISCHDVDGKKSKMVAILWWWWTTARQDQSDQFRSPNVSLYITTSSRQKNSHDPKPQIHVPQGPFGPSGTTMLFTSTGGFRGAVEAEPGSRSLQ